jgi:phage N-6-adenine-methyltransferase
VDLETRLDKALEAAKTAFTKDLTKRKMKGQDALLSSLKTGGKDSWQTPRHLIETIKSAYGEIKLDPCTTLENPVGATEFFTEDGATNDGRCGLQSDWGNGLVFVNYPYSQAKEWAIKIQEEAQKQCEIITICPSRTDTKWFRRLVKDACIIQPFGRIHFVDPDDPNKKSDATFPSVLVLHNVAPAPLLKLKPTWKGWSQCL